MIQVLRFASVFALIFAFLIVSLCLNVIFWSRWTQQRLRTKALSFFCRLGLNAIGIQTESYGWSGKKRAEFNGPQLFVCNHMSYLDIIVLSAFYPTGYVTSVEIREMPFIGFLTKLAGCLYVERRNKINLIEEIADLTEALKQGINVTVFPEATSTNGEEILRFRSPLYQAAIEAKVPVQPLCLNYVKIGTSQFSRTNRDLVCWYGDMDFLPHLWKLCGAGGVEAHIHFLNPILPKFPDEPKTLAAQTQEQVTRYFRPAL